MADIETAKVLLFGSSEEDEEARTADTNSMTENDMTSTASQIAFYAILYAVLFAAYFAIFLAFHRLRGGGGGVPKKPGSPEHKIFKVSGRRIVEGDDYTKDVQMVLSTSIEEDTPAAEETSMCLPNPSLCADDIRKKSMRRRSEFQSVVGRLVEGDNVSDVQTSSVRRHSKKSDSYAAVTAVSNQQHQSMIPRREFLPLMALAVLTPICLIPYMISRKVLTF